ncbi:MAG TPA: hypothetical protein VER08_06560 [Pyrinomonadaceae bacterium]|nr:hypothetical protein [Pyrinomonadaceae bacterium]
MNLRATRRRQRSEPTLASPESVRAVCQMLRERCPELIPRGERELRLMLESVRNVERRPATDTKRGRPPRWERARLLEVARHLRAVLERETGGRISLQSFIGHHMRVLLFPPDVQAALTEGRANLQEAAQLARLTPARLNCTPAEARAQRAELLQSHIAAQGSQNRLRQRVKELLGEVQAQQVSGGGLAAVIERADELLEVDPSDARHMFWEEMKRLFFAMREVEPEDLDEQTLDDFMSAMDGVSSVLARIEARRRKREQAAQATRKMDI